MSETIYQRLAAHGVPYERVDHPAVFTCDEAARLVPAIAGARLKNLFLTDRKGRRHFLVAVPPAKSVDVKALGRALGAGGMRLASPRRLREHLGVEPGSVTLLAAANDAAGAVEVLLDAALARADRLRCHPLVNTATLSIPRGDLERFLAATGHPPRYLEVPARAPQGGRG